MWLYLPVTSKHILGDYEIYLHLFPVQGLLGCIKLWNLFSLRINYIIYFYGCAFVLASGKLSKNHFLFVLTEQKVQ